MKSWNINGIFFSNSGLYFFTNPGMYMDFYFEKLETIKQLQLPSFEPITLCLFLMQWWLGRSNSHTESGQYESVVDVDSWGATMLASVFIYMLLPFKAVQLIHQPQIYCSHVFCSLIPWDEAYDFFFPASEWLRYHHSVMIVWANDDNDDDVGCGSRTVSCSGGTFCLDSIFLEGKCPLITLK